MPNKGFTLSEALATLAILCVLASVAAPAFNHFLQRQHLRSVTHQLHASLNLARQAAITRRRPVLVLNKESNWNNGWTIFVDTDNDGQQGTAEEILLEVAMLPGSIQVSSNLGHYARYRANGRSAYVSGAFMAGTWLICARDLGGTGHKLVMSMGGRVRSSPNVGNTCD